MKRTLFLVLAAALLAACTRVTTETARGTGNPWTQHGVVRVGSYEDLDNLNPLLSSQAFVSDVCQMVFSGLIDYDDKGDPVPDVAREIPSERNGGISRDGKTITYRLRHGVRFSDGVELTADDVVYTWRQIMNPDNDLPYRSPYDEATSVSAADRYTVVVKLPAPSAPFLAFFMRNGIVGSILPKHVLENVKDMNKNAFSHHPIGSGPFVVERWEPGVELTLRPNKFYWRGPPKLAAIHYRIIPNQNTLLTAVRTHEVDFYYDAPETQMSQLQAIPGYRVTAVPNNTYEHIVFNTRHPPLGDVRVRQAIAHAIDWRYLADKVYLGVDRPGMADVSPLSWGNDPTITPYSHDIALAKRLMRQSGWTMGADGLAHKGDRTIHLVMSTVVGISTRAKVEEIVQQELRDIGIDLTVRNHPANLLFATYGADGVLQRGRFDVALYAWADIPDPDDSRTMGPDALPPKGQNDTFYADPEIGAWQSAERATYDRSKRLPYLKKIQQRIHDAVPFHTIVWRANIDIVNRDLRNFKPAPAVSDFWNSYEWEI